MQRLISAGGRKLQRHTNGLGRVKKVKRRERLGEGEIGLVKRTHGADVLPITFEDVGKKSRAAEQARDDLPAKIGHGVVERSREYVPVENVDTHRGETVFLAGLRRSEAVFELFAERKAGDDGRILGFLDKLRDGKIVGHAHDAEALDARGGDGYRSHGDIRARSDMLVDDFAKIHPVELVTREDQHEIVRKSAEMDEVAPHGVGRALIPILALVRLLGCEDVHEATAKRIEAKGVLHMAMQ